MGLVSFEFFLKDTLSTMVTNGQEIVARPVKLPYKGTRRDLTGPARLNSAGQRSVFNWVKMEIVSDVQWHGAPPLW